MAAEPDQAAPITAVPLDSMYSLSLPWWERFSLRQIALGTAAVALTLLGVLLLVELRTVLLLLFLGIVLATALAPIAGQLLRFGVGRTTATLTAFTLLLLLVAAVIVTLVPFFIDQVVAVAGKLPASYAALRSTLEHSSLPLLRQLGVQLPNALGGGTDAGGIGSLLAGQVPSLGSGLLVAAMVLLLSYYWLTYREQAVGAATLLLPPGWRAEALALWQEIETKIGAFVRGLALMGLAIGLLSALGYWLIGLPYALTIAVVAALLEAIPYIGPFITMTLAVLVGLSVSPTLGALTLVVALVIQFLEGYVIVPRVMDQAVGVHPVVTLLALGVFADLFGLLGAILAIPLAAVFQVLIDRLVRRDQMPEQLTLDRADRLGRMRAKVQALTTALHAQAQQPDAAPHGQAQVAAHELEDWLEDLDGVLAVQQEQGR